MYNGKPFFKIPRPLLLAGGVENKTIAATLQLTDRDSLFQMIDGGGSTKLVKLPALKDGRVYAILNSGATNDLSIQDVDGGGVITLSPNEFVCVVCDGAQWYTILNVNNL
jgi:hypothetical protein